MQLVRPTFDTFLAQPWVRDTRVFTPQQVASYASVLHQHPSFEPDPALVTIGDVAQHQIRIAVDGPPDDKHVRAETDAARAVLAAPGASYVEQSLRRFASLMGRQGGTGGFDGIVFSNTDAEFAAGQLVSRLECGGRMPAPSDVARERSTYHDWVGYLLPAMTTTGVSNHWGGPGGNWLNMSPNKTARYFDLVTHPDRVPTPLDERWGAYLALYIRHEAEHGISQVTPADAARFHDGTTAGITTNWMREGTTDVVASWPGQIAETAVALGLPCVANPVVGVGAYAPYDATIRGLLELAGVDTTSASAFDRANSLLKGRRLSEVPGALADAIAAQHALGPAQRDRVESTIFDLDGTPPSVDRVRAEL